MFNQVVIGLLVIGTLAGALMVWGQWAVLSDKYKQYRLRTPTAAQSIPLERKVTNIGLNMTFTALIFVAAMYFFSAQLFHANATPAVMIFGEVLASLMLYDLLYYFMHRTLHHPKLMKFIHGIHHRARFPTTMESLFLHPVEAFAGLVLLLGSTMVIGPVNWISFLLIIFIHTIANVLVHMNLVLPHPIFKLSNFWAVKHDYHHGKHLNRNFASIFPFWDMMFGTYQ